MYAVIQTARNNTHANGNILCILCSQHRKQEHCIYVKIKVLVIFYLDYIPTR